MDEERQPWLSWGSFHWGSAELRERGGIMMLPLEMDTGMPKEGAVAKPVAGRPGNWAIEASYIIHRNDYFYLFVSFDFCCRGANSTYNIRVGRADAVDGPYTDRGGTPMSDGGGTFVLEGDGARIRGPGHNSVLIEEDEYWLVHHFYDAANNGVPTLQIRSLIWDDDG